jgi:phosphotransferase system HPr (HPr) family protein
LFVQTASRFRSVIKVANGKQVADGKSILSLMLLGAAPGAEITIEAEGEDEAEALNALAELITGRFGEEP